MGQSQQLPPPIQGQPWWNKDDIAVVTGASRGIGWEIARMLVEAGVSTILTARNEASGQQAFAKLASFAKEHNTPITFHTLDISSPASIEDFTDWLKKSYGEVTFLVNNAGVAFKGSIFGPDEARVTLQTNFNGTAALCESLQPLLRSNIARIVNISSISGCSALRNCSEELRQRFLQARSKKELEQLADEFVEAIKAGEHSKRGWPSSMYGVSKLCESMYTRVLAEELRGKKIMVNACCPGHCATDMSSWSGSKSAAEGADTPVYLALRPPEDFVTGRFWSDREERPF